MSLPVDDRELDDLIQVVDLDALIRLVDERCDNADWAGLLRVRDRCAAAAIETGRQLWPAATLSEYRLALLAPAEWAATVLDGEAGRFTIGPLSEVAAVSHTWSELGPLLDPVPVATFVAFERALRGETIPDDDLSQLVPVLDIPATVQPWEPAYPISTYHREGADHPTPAGESDDRSTWTSVDVPATPDTEVVDDDATELAVRQLVDAWTSASTGRAEVVCAHGDHLAAIGALGVRSARVASIEAAEAMALLAWAGASGGAQARRRGMALGRFSAWWVLGAIGDLHDDWPPTADEIDELLGALRWYRWDAHEPDEGWRLQLAIHDTAENLAWAINASDNAEQF